MTLPIGSTGALQTFSATTAQSGPLNVSIVTRVKNRKAHLLEALPTWLKLPVAEIVIVDWGSTDADLRQYIDFLDDDRIVLVTRNENEFQRSRAWNVGIAQASAEWVFLLDCDVKVVGPVFNDPMFSVPNYDNFYRPYTDRYLPSLFGCAVVLKEHWQAVGGFNEDLIGWGWEDVDFYRRVTAQGYREVTLPVSHFQPIPHADEDRTSHHREKDLRLSVAANAYRASQVAKISLATFDLGTLHRLGVDVRATRYQQTITYHRSMREIASMVEAPAFERLVKKYNVFGTPTGVLELFDTDEFKTLGPEETMKITLFQAHLARDAIAEMKLIPVPIATAFRLAELFEALASHLRSFDATKHARAAQLGLKGKDDNSEAVQLLETEMRQLLETEVDVDAGVPFVVSDFGAVNIAPQTAAHLQPFIRKPSQEADKNG